MRIKTPLILAAAALATATPALAQNTGDPAANMDLTTGNTVGTEGLDPAMAPPPGTQTSPTGAAAAPGDQSAVLPADSGAMADPATGGNDNDDGHFPWGVLGALGLLGLLGRRRANTANRR